MTNLGGEPNGLGGVMTRLWSPGGTTVGLGGVASRLDGSTLGLGGVT